MNAAAFVRIIEGEGNARAPVNGPEGVVCVAARTRGCSL
jgi:hypothetical protein